MENLVTDWPRLLPKSPRSAPKAQPLRAHLRASDLRAAAQLATSATHNITRIAEGVNQAVWSTLGAPSGATPDQTRGITGLVFNSIRSITTLVGKGVDTALAKLLPYIEPPSSPDSPPTAEREAVLAALNGVLGDHLAASGNALATPMTLRYQGQPLDWQAMPPKRAVKGKVLLLIHGLCMNDLQWRSTQPTGEVMDHGATLAAAMQATPLYLRYNTGLHTSTNGHTLSALLDQLMTHWRVPITELTIIVHSMGGLVTRSAVHAAQNQSAPNPHAKKPDSYQGNAQVNPGSWLTALKSIVFLGTPHHGAPLEKAGNWIDILLGSTPYSKPFAKLGQLRSAGITDLRYGFTLDTHWQGKDRFRRSPDHREPLPLPQGVACYTIAGTLAAPRSTLSQRMLGDGLVTLPSALGQHSNLGQQLAFDKSRQFIAYRTHHMHLLSSPVVSKQMLAWLA